MHRSHRASSIIRFRTVGAVLLILALIGSACSDDNNVFDTAPTTGPTSSADPNTAETTLAAASTTTDPRGIYHHPFLTDEEIAFIRDVCLGGDRDACEELYAATGEGTNPAAAGYGDDPALDALFDICGAGNAGACKTLAESAPEDSGYVDLEFAGREIGDLTDLAIAEGAHSYGDDPTLDALWDGCEAGVWQDCDQLYVVAPAGSEYEAVGSACGGYGGEALGCDLGYGDMTILQPEQPTIGDPGITFDDTPAVIITFTGPDGTLLPGQMYRLLWQTAGADCGVFLNGLPVLANDSIDIPAPSAPTTVRWTLVARDATCNAATQAFDTVEIQVVAASPDPTDAPGPTVDTGPRQIVWDTVELAGVESIDLDTGKVSYTSSNPPGADVAFARTYSDEDEYRIAHGDGDGSGSYALQSVPPNAWFDHPDAGVADYDDCLATLPEGIIVLTTPSIASSAIPMASDNGAVRLCYRTDEGRLGVLLVSLIPNGAGCWGDDCMSHWAARISYTTWARPEE